MQTLLRALQSSLLTTYKSKFTQARSGSRGASFLFLLTLRRSCPVLALLRLL